MIYFLKVNQLIKSTFGCLLVIQVILQLLLILETNKTTKTTLIILHRIGGLKT